MLLATFTAAVAPVRRNHIATVGGLMCIVHVAKVAVFDNLGVGFGSYRPLMGAMIATSVVGIWLGRMALGRIPERLFRITSQVILTALALRLIWIATAAP
jgi:putative Ca2+/H+ antiporter (TMEM165/GDT1 family)